jgi:hypothetical protein
MKPARTYFSTQPVEGLIHIIRSRKVILDADLARIYGVTTSRLNQQVQRNPERFPDDFVFRLTKEEQENLMFQIATSSSRHGGRRKLPTVFTEHGAIMAASVLNRGRAVQMSVFVVRAFVKMQAVLVDNKALAGKLTELEHKLTDRLDVHEKAIVQIVRELRQIVTAPAPSEIPHKRIGFDVRERRTRYGVTA